MPIDRRRFIAVSMASIATAASAAAGLPGSGALAAEPTRQGTGKAASSGPGGSPATGATVQPATTTRRGDMAYRQLGRTGATVSLIGLGGFHIGKQQDEAESIRIIRSAIDRGITFMDNSWDYNEGQSEVRMGKALQDGYRDKVFLMTKLDGRDKKTAARQIDESLQRLRTDRLDLLQIHEVIRLEDPDVTFRQGGAIEAVLEAQQAGKTRFIGFTGHKDPMVHLRMLEIAEAKGVSFDTVQMPLNLLDVHFRSFQHQVLPMLLRKGTGVLGMKPMAETFILKSGAATAMECLHYSMSLPVSVVITGIDSMAILDQAVEAARTFRQLSEKEIADLEARSRQAAAGGTFEPYKTSSTFDATARKVEWLGDTQV